MLVNNNAYIELPVYKFHVCSYVWCFMIDVYYQFEREISIIDVSGKQDDNNSALTLSRDFKELLWVCLCKDDKYLTICHTETLQNVVFNKIVFLRLFGMWYRFVWMSSICELSVSPVDGSYSRLLIELVLGNSKYIVHGSKNGLL